MRVSIVFVLLLAACTPSAAPEVPVSPEAPAPPPSAPQADDATASQMPEALLGAFDTNTEACASPSSQTRLVVSPDTLRFWYGYATVDAVDARAGGVDVEATMYQLEGAVEVVPETTTYRVEGSGDRLRFDGPGDMPELSLVRCGDGTDDGTGSSAGME